MTVRVAEIGERDVPWRLRARHADRKGLVDVDAVDRRHDRHIIAGQAVEIGVAVCAAQIGLGIDPLHDDRGRIVAPAVHFRYRNAFTLKQAQHVILTAQRLHFLSGIAVARSEEHTSELQSLMRISYAVFCLKKKKMSKTTTQLTDTNDKI